MATAAELAQLIASLQDARSQALSLETTEDLQVELDGVNSRLEAVSAQVQIVLGILGSSDYSETEKLNLISQTLGPQE